MTPLWTDNKQRKYLLQYCMCLRVATTSCFDQQAFKWKLWRSRASHCQHEFSFFYFIFLITSVYVKYFLVVVGFGFFCFSFENVYGEIKLEVNLQCAQTDTRILCYCHWTSQDSCVVTPPVNTNSNWKLIRQDHFSQEQVYIGQG